jgi:uncharacterized protein (TIGR00299 family) protein
LDCTAGISGDMLVGALLDLGWPEEEMHAALAKLGLEAEFHCHTRRVDRCGISCVKFDVHAHSEEAHGHPHPHEHSHGPAHHPHSHEHGHEHGHAHEHFHQQEHSHGRNFAEIAALVRTAGYGEEIAGRVVAVFHRIAVAEGKIHGQPPEEVCFHEVGAIDSLVDIVAGCCGLSALGITRVEASIPIEGTGTIHCAHGHFPLPAPATLEILQGIPLRQVAEPGERVTPTGAAFLAEFATRFGPFEGGVVRRIGYGAGTRNPAHYPNLLRAVLWEENPAGETPGRVVEIRSNLDDCTGENLGHLRDRLEEAGALDVCFVPCTMKKGRPGVQVQIVGRVADRELLCGVLLRESTAFGLRWQECAREVLEREMTEVPTPFGPVAVKLGRRDGAVWQWSPEYESCRAVASAAGVPWREVYQAALRRSAQD